MEEKELVSREITRAKSKPFRQKSIGEYMAEIL